MHADFQPAYARGRVLHVPSNVVEEVRCAAFRSMPHVHVIIISHVHAQTSIGGSRGF